MIGTGGSQFRESRTIVAVDEPKHTLVVLHGSDRAVAGGDQSTNEWNDFRQDPSPIGFRQRFEPRAAKRLLSAIVFFDVARRLVDDLERSLVTALVVVAPGTHAVMTEKHSL